MRPHQRIVDLLRPFPALFLAGFEIENDDRTPRTRFPPQFVARVVDRFEEHRRGVQLLNDAVHTVEDLRQVLREILDLHCRLTELPQGQLGFRALGQDLFGESAEPLANVRGERVGAGGRVDEHRDVDRLRRRFDVDDRAIGVVFTDRKVSRGQPGHRTAFFIEHRNEDGFVVPLPAGPGATGRHQG